MLFSGVVATLTPGSAVVLGAQRLERRRAAGGRRHARRLGGAALLKGVMLLLVPGERIAAAYKGVGFERSFQVWMVVVLTLRAARDVAGVCRLRR